MLKVELEVFPDEVSRSDWSDSFDFGESQYLSDALINASAARNRMTAPQLGRWEITIKNTETEETVIVHDNEGGHFPSSGRRARVPRPWIHEMVSSNHHLIEPEAVPRPIQWNCWNCFTEEQGRIILYSIYVYERIEVVPFWNFSSEAVPKFQRNYCTASREASGGEPLRERDVAKPAPSKDFG